MDKQQKQKSYRQGLWAENLAALYLMLKGYRIMERRYKTKVGEIDLIGKKGKSLLFIEVKIRKDMDMALSAVNKSSQKRIQRAAEYFLSTRQEYADYALRFDLIAMAPPFHLRHLDNAWQIRA